MSKPKRVNYELIAEFEDPYRILEQARKWHGEIRSAKIALAWRIALKPDVDGRLVLGKCVKVTDLHKEFAKFDFIVLLNQEIWMDREFDDAKKLALMDHELCHAAPSLEKDTLEDKFDERGRRIWRSRKHDIEEFQDVVSRHGCYKRDLENFAEALLKKQQMPLLANAR